MRFTNEHQNVQEMAIPKDSTNGDCYVQAYQYFQSNAHRDRSLRLVHGLVTGQGKLEGLVYNHAWCESKNKVIDTTLPKKFQKSLSVREYYEIGKIKTVFKYDFNEHLDKVVEYETYGPWEKILIRNKY
jgi:hypothetical protein